MFSSTRISAAIIFFAAINGYIALDYSGYAAHGLEEVAGEYAIAIYHTSAKYQMWHVFALIGTAVLYELWDQKYVRLCLLGAALGFAIGMSSFCWGMYQVPFGGTLTPAIAGAVIMMVGWVFFGLAAVVRVIKPYHPNIKRRPCGDFL